VTLPLHLVEPAALDGVGPGRTLRLDGDEGRHAATVRRTSVGEQLDLADGAGRRVRCTVTAVERSALELIVDGVSEEPEPWPRLVLVQALAKGGRDELAVETATELGADAIVPWQAGRSVVVWHGDRGLRAHGKWVDAVRAAAKQSRRARVPVVEPALSSSALAARLAAAASAGARVLALHEDAATPLGNAVGEPVGDGLLPAPTGRDHAQRSGLPGEVWVVVGPEGGIEASELAAFEQAGALPVRIGPHVLRSSTAGPAALAVLAERLGRWS
jgi:16S rRNA (uracil1498-N3)-methyltransferase